MTEAQQIMFTVLGPPQPKARARVVNGRAYTPKSTAQYEQAVKAAALRAIKRGWPLDARYSVLLTVTFADRRRRDLDNVLKAVMDACNGVVWRDDCQVDVIAVYRCEPSAKGAKTTVAVDVIA